MLKSTLLHAVQVGAAQLQHFFNGEFKISNKEGINNLVTEADHAAEKAIIETASLYFCSSRRVSIWLFAVNFNFIFSIGQRRQTGRYKMPAQQQALLVG
jgi:hypothetical protein